MMTPKRIAVIDLGTNTFHLLISEKSESGLTTIYSEKTPVRIGKGGINLGYITDEACERAVQTLHKFRAKIIDHKVDIVYATATSAFRNAKNGKDLAKRIEKETDIKITIISGEREAELIYLGIKEALEIGLQKSLIIDIGGGSVEFIIADGNTIFWKHSFEIGGQRLMELFQKSDPIAVDEINALENYLSEQLIPLSEALKKFPTHQLIGSSGSFDTFSEIDIKRKGFDYSIETRKEYALDLSDFYSIYQDLISKNRTERMEISGMIELRVDMIVVASVLVRFLIETYEMNQLRVSTYALKEGVMKKVATANS